MDNRVNRDYSMKSAHEWLLFTSCDTSKNPMSGRSEGVTSSLHHDEWINIVQAISMAWSFYLVLTRGIRLPCNQTFLIWRSVLLLTWSQWMIQQYYCKEQLDAGHSLRLNSSSPTSELNRISPYIIGTISSRQVNENKEKYELWDYRLVQF